MEKYFIAKIIVMNDNKTKYDGFYVGDLVEYYGVEPEISALVTDNVNLAKAHKNTFNFEFSMYHETIEDYVSGDIISTFGDAEEIDVIWIEIDRNTKQL